MVEGKGCCRVTWIPASGCPPPSRTTPLIVTGGLRVTVMVVSVLVGGMVKGVGARLLPAGGVTVPLLGLKLVVVGSQRRLAWPLLSVVAVLCRKPLVIV